MARGTWSLSLLQRLLLHLENSYGSPDRNSALANLTRSVELELPLSQPKKAESEDTDESKLKAQRQPGWGAGMVAEELDGTSRMHMDREARIERGIKKGASENGSHLWRSRAPSVSIAKKKKKETTTNPPQMSYNKQLSVFSSTMNYPILGLYLVKHSVQLWVFLTFEFVVL